MIWVRTSDGEMTYLGAEWDDYIPAASSEPRRQIIFSRVAEADREATYRLVGEAFETGQPFHVVFHLRHVDGSYRRMLARGAPTFHPADGKLVGFVGNTVEIADTDPTVSGLGWPDTKRAGHVETCGVGAIIDHMLVARALAEVHGEIKLAAICEFALAELRNDLGLDLRTRQ